MKKRNTSLERYKDDLAQSAVEHTAASHAVVQKDDALLMLGGIGAIKHLTDKLSAQTLRALEAFGEAKGYEELGFSTFADFLDNSSYSPLTKNQFYDRKKTLELEGDAAYDLLNNIGVPISVRKLLKGEVQVEGNTITVGEERFTLTDRGRIIEVIKTLADKNSEQSRTIERGQSEVTKLKKKLDQARKASSAIRRADTPTHDQALMDVLIAMGRYAEECQKLSDEEVAEVRDKALNLISEQWQNIRIAHRFPDAPPATAPLNGHRRSSGLSDADLEDLQDVM